MKFTVLFCLAALALCGCNRPADPKVEALEKRIAALESKVAGLTNPPAATVPATSDPSAQIADVKIWTLGKLESLETREAQNRYELKTNLLDFVGKAVEIAIKAK